MDFTRIVFASDCNQHIWFNAIEMSKPLNGCISYIYIFYWEDGKGGV